jgi:carboxyl-terminal processing protease
MLKHQRHIRIGRALLFSVFLLGVLYAGALSKAPAPSIQTESTETLLAPLPEHAGSLKEVIQRLQREHVSTISYNDELASKLLNRYLENLDPARSFFMQSDIDAFARYRTTLDDDLRDAHLEAAFSIFNRFQQRRTRRIEAVIARLEAGINDMDFTLDESLEADRKDAPWAKDQAELDQLWNKLLKLNILNLLLAEKTPEETREVLLKRFNNQLRLVHQTNSEDVFQVFMNALASCYDPHTQYFSPRTSENFNISMSLSLEGIGAVLTSEDEYTKVVRLVPGGPADKSKQLQPADRIVGVGQGGAAELQDVVGWRLDDVVDLIRGPKGTIVSLEVIPAGTENLSKTRKFAIERSTVTLEDQAARKNILSVESGGRSYTLGVIELPTFYLDFHALQAGDTEYKSTAKDIDRLLQECSEKNIDGLILDLRNNGGGSLQEAIELCGKFLRYGPIVQVRSARDRIEVLRDSDHRIKYDGPLLVMVNRLSASASEIVAGAIQDYGRGIVFGAQTFGKGTVQSLIPLDHGQLKATLATFYRVTGESTQYRGIIPDITYPDLVDPKEIGESSLSDALNWDTIDAVPFPPYQDLSGARITLEHRHNYRMHDDPDYHYLLNLTRHLRTLGARTSISLSRPQREREQTDVKQFRLTLENKLRAKKNMPLYKSFSDLEKERSSDNATDTPDAMLEEATHILIDYISLSTEQNRTARSWNSALLPLLQTQNAAGTLHPRHRGPFPQNECSAQRRRGQPCSQAIIPLYS